MRAAARDHAQAHEDLAPHGGRYESILEAIGHTPLVAVPRMSPNPAVRIYAKLEFMNPTGSVKDRAARALVEDLEVRGALASGFDHPRTHVGQHRDRPCDDRAPAGLSDRARHAGQRDPGAPPGGGALRRGDHRLARPSRLEWGDRAGEGPRGAGSALRDAVPVRQPSQPARPRGDHGSGDPRRLPRGGRGRRRPRNGWNADGRRTLLPAGEARGPDHRRGAAARRGTPGAPFPGRGIRAGNPGSDAPRCEAAGLEPRRDLGGARPHRPARASSPVPRPARSSWPPRAWRARWPRARSSPSCRTAAGSTSPRAPTLASWTRWRPISREASTGGDRGRGRDSPRTCRGRPPRRDPRGHHRPCLGRAPERVVRPCHRRSSGR